MPQQDRSRAQAALLSLGAAGLACAGWQPAGLQAADPRSTDRFAARAIPSQWRMVAVLPFGGAPSHRRPAEELVAAVVQRSSRVAVVPPFRVALAARREGAPPDAAALRADAWVSAYADPSATHPRADARETAARLGVDALVVGRVAPGGAAAELVVVDGRSGDAIATLRRAGSASAVMLGVHELAMSSTRKAADDLVTVLATRLGHVPASPAAAASPEGDP